MGQGESVPCGEHLDALQKLGKELKVAETHESPSDEFKPHDFDARGNLTWTEFRKRLMSRLEEQVKTRPILTDRVFVGMDFERDVPRAPKAKNWYDVGDIKCGRRDRDIDSVTYLCAIPARKFLELMQNDGA